MTEYRTFWNSESFAVVGNSEKKKFPVLTYRELKKVKNVYPVDPAADEIEGDSCYPDLKSLPEGVDGVVLEVPPDETVDWIEQASAEGIDNVWIHQRCETPEAISLAREKGMNLWYGTCAVMYLTSGLSPHTLHGWINRLIGKY